MGKRIDKFCVEQIQQANVIADVVKNYQAHETKTGDKNFNTKDEPKLSVSPRKNMATDFRAGTTYFPVTYLTKVQGKSYYEALHEVAELANIQVIYEEDETPPATGKKQITQDIAVAADGQTELTEPTPVKVASAKPPRQKPHERKQKFTTFRDQMLHDSGLEEEDQTIQVIREVKGQEVTQEISVYQPGSINNYDFTRPDPTGNDVIIHYIGLDRKEVMVQRTVKGNPKGKYFPFVRVRHQNPAHHKDKNGKSKKYESPMGTGTHLYFPVPLINAYQDHRQFDTLYIQEGEKKADKAAKHGLMSVGIGGITSIAQNGALPAEFNKIISRCGVKNIVFIVDADYQDIGNSSKEAVNHRPNSFFHAVKNYRAYFYEFRNVDIHLNIYFGFINGTENKGIDDLFVANPGKENAIKKDVTATLNKKDGVGKYLTIHNITVTNPGKLLQYWKLHDKDAFFKHHFETLKERQFFKYKRQKYRYDEETNYFVLDQPLLEEEYFYNVQKKEVKGTDITTYGFDYVGLLNFMQNRGYHRYRLGNKQTIFVHLGTDRIIQESEIDDLKDYVMEFCRENITDKQERKDVMNMILSGQEKYLGAKTFGNLKYTTPQFHVNTKAKQYYYFNDKYVEITPTQITSVEYKQLNGFVWQDRIIDRQFTLLEPFWNASLTTDGQLEFEILENQQLPVFLEFLERTSNFFHRKPTEHLTDAEVAENNTHLVNKLTGLGYMLHTYFNPTVTKMVFSLDGKESEIGESHGRSGKSLMGKAISEILPTAMIDGKKYEKDNYPWEHVSERTPHVFIDDPNEGFDVERFFSIITGNWMVEKKGKGSFIIPKEFTPKVYVATNHAVRAENSSARDRVFFTSYSDYYTDERKPSDPEEFGHMFFDEWDAEEYNRFLNLAFRAVQLYLQIGLVPIQTSDIKQRQFRSIMGEPFRLWAEQYFYESIPDPVDGKRTRIGERISRYDMYNAYKANVGKNYAASPARFKQKILAFCKYNRLIFNPGVPNLDPKTNEVISEHGGRKTTGGMEFFTIADFKNN